MNWLKILNTVQVLVMMYYRQEKKKKKKKKETDHENIFPKASVIVRCKTIERIQRVLFLWFVLISHCLLTSVVLILCYVLLNLNSTVYCTKLKFQITQALITYWFFSFKINRPFPLWCRRLSFLATQD